AAATVSISRHSDRVRVTFTASVPSGMVTGWKRICDTGQFSSNAGAVRLWLESAAPGMVSIIWRAAGNSVTSTGAGSLQWMRTMSPPAPVGARSQPLTVGAADSGPDASIRAETAAVARVVLMGRMGFRLLVFFSDLRRAAISK